ncbi:MAG: DUF177 domain-containing protein [Clostridia bacterium]|nr:DUF177 domain-containing protein [Clostridia bacterium]
MVLDLRSLFVNDNENLPLDCRFDLSDVEFYGEKPLKAPVEVKGKAFSRSGIVTLSVVCDCEYSAPCDRCGVETVKHYKVPIERVLVAKLENGENDEIILLQDFKLDLYELIFTEVVLAMPSKHLCSKDCKGLCQSCGKNLNDGPCGCATKSVDPRLAALSKLLENE